MKKEKEKDLEQLRKEVAEKSGYRRADPCPKKWMLASEMGKLLGLKKTERYWLIHKNYFRTENLLGMLRIDIESFEKWYANQVKYHKVTGEEPGLELKEKSYSPRDIANMLGVNECTAYDIIRQYNLETIVVDFWKRVPKEVFWNWYNGQSRYRTFEDRERDAALEAETITMPEMAKLLGITRQEVYNILRNKKYEHYFKSVIIADRKRIYKKGFEEFLAGQDCYHLKNTLDINEQEGDENAKTKHKPSVKVEHNKKCIAKKKYLTLDEAAEYAGVSRSMISRWYIDGKFPAVYIGNSTRIPMKEFEQWIAERKDKDSSDGNDKKAK